VSDHDFIFALEIADAAASAPMVSDLCTTVLGHVGYGAPAILELTKALAEALAQGAANGAGRCDVRFLARDGALQIVVSCRGSVEWRTTRPLPVS
jgi:hypothetical protein